MSLLESQLQKYFLFFKLVHIKNLNESQTTLLKIKTTDNEIKILKYRTEKQYHENILKPLKIHNNFYKKKYKHLNKKKVLLINTEDLIGSGSAVSVSTMSLINLSISVVLTSFSKLLTSIVILISKDYVSKLKLRYTNLRDWINVITLLYERH